MANEDVLKMVEQLNARLADLKQAVTQYGCPASLPKKIDRIDDRIYALETEALRLGSNGETIPETSNIAQSSAIEDPAAFARFDTTETLTKGNVAEKALRVIQQTRFRLEDLKSAVLACECELPGYARELDQLDDIVYSYESSIAKMAQKAELETTESPNPTSENATSGKRPLSSAVGVFFLSWLLEAVGANAAIALVYGVWGVGGSFLGSVIIAALWKSGAFGRHGGTLSMIVTSLIMGALAGIITINALPYVYSLRYGG